MDTTFRIYPKCYNGVEYYTEYSYKYFRNILNIFNSTNKRVYKRFTS